MKVERMDEWTEWISVEDASKRRGPFERHGIYEIRLVRDPEGEPIHLRRIAGIDSRGMIYVGRSGYRQKSPNRTISNRIREFRKQQHSGGRTWARTRQVLERHAEFLGMRLQVRACFLEDSEIDIAEGCALDTYFEEFGELPPCNSQTAGAGATSEANALPNHTRSH